VRLGTDHPPLTSDRWTDLEAVFLAKGCSMARGCWCMYYRELETYPVDKEIPGADAWLWNGPKSLYRKAGFVEVARRRPERSLQRLV
jgi:hypothetical protein